VSWRRAAVAADGSHHIVDGVAAYAERFDRVLPFHEPGLAPVQRREEAWHIDPLGRPGYARRFVRTFGFYESRAAVLAADGAHHIREDGSDLSTSRYAWCGNFQSGRCTVRDLDGLYHHIDGHGRTIGEARWRYAGDFREGNAVVQAGDGRSTHVDRDGRITHDAWFHDLDVFHKGLARARDDAGWMHIARDGRAVYPRRFANVEPFYNGQARVERFDGGLEVISEAGERIIELRAGQPTDDFHALPADIVG